MAFLFVSNNLSMIGLNNLKIDTSGSSQTKDIVKINKQWFNEYIGKSSRGNN